jgi:hypothetical protein
MSLAVKLLGEGAKERMSHVRPHPGPLPQERENSSPLTRIFRTLVARISNPLYRRASSLRRARKDWRGWLSTPCRLEIGDPAGWKPALRRFAIESVGMGCQMSGLTPSSNRLLVPARFRQIAEPEPNAVEAAKVIQLPPTLSLSPGERAGARASAPRSLCCLLLLTVVAAGNFTQAATGYQTLSILSSNAEPPTVGMEGQLEVILPEAGLTAKTPDLRTPLLLRIAHTQPHGTLTRYDLRYIGRVPGKHDLREYLFNTNGLPATNLAELIVTVSGVLPEQHNGWLEEQALHAPSFFGGYRAVAAIVVLLWILSLFVILRVGRKPKAAVVEAPVQREPTFAERLRPLVERAAAGALSADEKAALERMLIHHWQRRLGLAEADSGELIARLRQHAEAGALLRALEDWLHRPPGGVKVEVESVLAPYRNLPEEATAEVRV